MKAIAVDDEPLALVVLKNFCDRVGFLELKGAFTEANEAMKYIEEHPVDVLFLDINMPSISGIELYKKIKKNIPVVFTTAHTEYAIEGFNLSAVDYLLKPFSFERFLSASEKAKEYYDYTLQKENAALQYLYLKVDYSMVKVAMADIIYIEGLDNYIKFYLENNKTLLVRMSMKAITEKLPEKEFVRVHRSYIVSLKKALSMRSKHIFLPGKEIPVGTNYVDEVSRLFE